MNIFTECAVLFILILNQMCTGQGNTGWTITFNPAEVTAVPGVCALISCSFTYPDEAKPIENIQWKVRGNGGQFKKDFFKQVVNKKKTTGTERIKMLEADLNKNNCSFIMKDIQAEDEKEYAFRVEGAGIQKNTYEPRVQIIIQDEPKMEIPALSEGVEANLTCSAPFPCPETPPDIKWWMKTIGENITDLKNDITLTTNERLYLSTLTLTPTSDLHRADVGCDVSYGNKTISTNRTLEVMYVQTQIQGKARLKEGETLNLSCSVESHPPSTDPVWSFRGNTEKLHNQTSAGHLMIPNVRKEHAGTYTCEMTYINKTLNLSISIDIAGATTETNESVTPKEEIFSNTTGIAELMKNLNIETILTFVAGMAFSAFIISMILCCWVSCHKCKKQKVPTSNPDTEIHLETVQTEVAQTGTNEQTPLHEQPDDESPNPEAPTDRAEEEEEEEAVATAGREVDYASIDYSLLKNRTPEEEEEKEPADTEYAEIKKDNKKSQAQQDGADPTPPDLEQTEGDEEIYSNTEMINSQERLNHTQH